MKILIQILSMCTLLLSGNAAINATPYPYTAFTTDTTFSGVGRSNEATVGWEFTANMPMTITEIGYFDSSGDGLMSSHQIGIWDANQNLILSTSVPQGTSATLDGAFRWISISPLSLTAGQSYVIAATLQDFPDDRILVMSDAVNLAFDPAVSFVEDRYEIWNPGLNYPAASDGRELLTYLNANFRGDVVPVPAAIWLFASGLLGLIAIGRFGASRSQG